MTGDRLRAHLDDREILRDCWTASIAENWRSQPAVLGATDRRLVWLGRDGSFGAVPYDHVTGVGSRREVRRGVEGVDYRVVVGAGALVALAGFVAAILAGSGLLALLLVLASVGGLGLADHGWRHRKEYDGVRRIETECRRLTVRTVDGGRREFAVGADERAHAELGRLVSRHSSRS